jgi:hypothetical protein
MTNLPKQRRVLLVEPGYRNKYPPLGLMKLAAYHRKRGDYVRFYKGDLRQLVVELYTETVVEKFYSINNRIDWQCYSSIIAQFIQHGRKTALARISELSGIFSPSITIWLKYYYKAYRTGRIDSCAMWDRVCVTSLFTFYFKQTIETIEYCKKFVFDENNVLVGGVMASLIPDEVEEATGIKPIVGLLDTPGILDKGDTTVIDQLPPDYSILEEIDYTYPENDGYYGYTSRGCIRKCDFCAVQILEPVFKDYFSISEQLEYIDRIYGARRNLLLLDNNVLASQKFPEIIQEIRANGFYRGAKFVSPNYLEISINNLKSGVNEFAYRHLAHSILIKFQSKLAGKTLEKYSQLLDDYEICNNLLPDSAQLINIYEHIKNIYENKRNRSSKYRYVDFNQGVDARLLTEEKMALLATIPIKPLRIAFDSMIDEIVKSYEKAVRLAAKYNITNLSNYLLYNHKDKPIELYQRMRINVELSNELGVHIYSFPMRFSPIWDKNNLHHGRTYIGKHWNKKFIRSIQTVLNATKGKVGTKLDFFKAAFGKDEKEFFDIMYMPEAYILHRRYCEQNGMTKSWLEIYHSLSDNELNRVLPIIENNDFSKINLSYFTKKERMFIKDFQFSPKLITQKEHKCEDETSIEDCYL